MEYLLVALVGICIQGYRDAYYDIDRPVYERQCYGGTESELLACAKQVQKGNENGNDQK